MQIIGKLPYLDAEFLKFFYGKIKQLPIVRLKKQLTAHTHQFQVQAQKIAVGQASFCLFGLGPGVAEVQVQGPDFPRGEPVFHTSRVAINDYHIIKTFGHCLLGRIIGNVKLGFNADKSFFRMQRGHSRNKTAFAAANLQTDLSARKAFLPAAFKAFNLFPVQKACPDHFGHRFFDPGLFS